MFLFRSLFAYVSYKITRHKERTKERESENRRRLPRPDCLYVLLVFSRARFKVMRMHPKIRHSFPRFSVAEMVYHE